jgi:hypothetical protein
MEKSTTALQVMGQAVSGPACLIGWERRWIKLWAVLPALPPEQIVHVSYREFASDTSKFALALRSRLGLPEHQAVAEKMRDWTSNNRRNGHEVHQYEAAAFGLNHEMIEGRFSSYRRMFGITFESRETYANHCRWGSDLIQRRNFHPM